eukprot:SAG31_NODE_773_length_12173_cov_15.778173_2_plen_65_part_00
MHSTIILRHLLIGLYTMVNRGFQYKILDPNPIHHWKAPEKAVLMDTKCNFKKFGPTDEGFKLRL